MSFYFSAIIRVTFDPEMYDEEYVETFREKATILIERYAKVPLHVAVSSSVIFDFPNRNRTEFQHILCFHLCRRHVNHVETVYRTGQIFEGLAYFLEYYGCSSCAFSLCDAP